jgi:hypothetical protein
MSSKPKGKGNAEPHPISARAAQTEEASVGNARHDKEIRRSAYEIYPERGEQPGRELDDWLQAERELEGGCLRRRARKLIGRKADEDRHEIRKFET